MGLRERPRRACRRAVVGGPVHGFRSLPWGEIERQDLSRPRPADGCRRGANNALAYRICPPISARGCKEGERRRRRALRTRRRQHKSESERGDADEQSCARALGSRVEHSYTRTSARIADDKQKSPVL